MTTNNLTTQTAKNARAAALARIAVEMYAAAAGLDLSAEGEGLDTAIGDLLSDLRHLTTVEQIDFYEIESGAQADYANEYSAARRERREGLVTEPVTPEQVAALAAQLRPAVRLFIGCDNDDTGDVRAFGATWPVELHVHYNRDGSVETQAAPVLTPEAFADELASYVLAPEGGTEPQCEAASPHSHRRGHVVTTTRNVATAQAALGDQPVIRRGERIELTTIFADGEEHTQVPLDHQVTEADYLIGKLIDREGQPQARLRFGDIAWVDSDPRRPERWGLTFAGEVIETRADEGVITYAEIHVSANTGQRYEVTIWDYDPAADFAAHGHGIGVHITGLFLGDDSGSRYADAELYPATVETTAWNALNAYLAAAIQHPQEDAMPRMLTEADRQDVTSEISQLAPGHSVGFVNEAIVTRSEDGESFTVEDGNLNGEAEPTRAALTLEQAVDAVLRATM